MNVVCVNTDCKVLWIKGAIMQAIYIARLYQAFPQHEELTVKLFAGILCRGEEEEMGCF